jgi:hypothetical protein
MTWIVLGGLDNFEVRGGETVEVGDSFINFGFPFFNPDPFGG